MTCPSCIIWKATFKDERKEFLLFKKLAKEEIEGVLEDANDYDWEERLQEAKKRLGL